MQEIFFDHQTTKRIFPLAISALEAFLKTSENFTREALYSSTEENMRKIFSLLKKKPQDQVFFSSSREQSVRSLFLSFAIKLLEKTKKDHFVVCNLQEEDVYKPLEEIGYKKSVVSIDISGEFDEIKIEKAIQKNTAFVSVIFSHPQTGLLFPIKKIAEICQKKEVFFHVDFPSYFSLPPEDFFSLPIDYITWGAENIGAPPLGLLIAKEKAFLASLVFSKTEKTNPIEVFSPYISCLAKMCEHRKEKEEKESMEISYLKNLFEKEIEKRIEKTTVVFSSAPRASHISCVSFLGVNSEALIFSLKERNFFANFFENEQKSFIKQLLLSGFSPLLAQSAVSFTFDAFCTKEKLFSAIEILVEEVVKLRKLSAKVFGEEK